MPKLYLSHWEEKDVSVPSGHVKDLKLYHVSAVRSLYDAYNRKYKGKIISYPDGINIAVILKSFISAIEEELDSKILILCEDENILLWRYELSKLTTVKIFDFKSSTGDFNIQNSPIIICSLQRLKDFQDIARSDWSLVVVENIESVVNKMAFKKIGDVQFKVALTKNDFTRIDDLKVFWYVLQWCNPGLFGKLIEFVDTHKQHCDNLRDPYDDIWHRIEWDLPDDPLGESDMENAEYNKLLQEWAKINGVDVKPTTRKGGVKRKDTKINGNPKIANGGKVNNNLKRRAKSFTSTPGNVSVKRVKSANDVDSIKLMLEDSWIEDFMKEIDVPQNPPLIEELILSNENKEDTIRNSTLSTIVETSFDSETEEIMKLMVTPEDPVENKPKPTNKLLQKYEKSSQSTRINENIEQYPILDAIIDGNSLEIAFEKYMFSMLGKPLEEELSLPQKKRNSQERIVQKKLQIQSQEDDLLTFLYGDQAAIISNRKSVLFDN